MDSVPLRRQTAIALARAGRVAELRRYADAGDPQGCRQLAALLVRTGHVAEVSARAAAGDRWARRAWADRLVRQGRLDEAIEQLRPLTDPGSGRRLARLLAGRGRVEEAASVVRARRLPGATVPAWLASQGRYDLLRPLAAAGDVTAQAEVAQGVVRLWSAGRLAAAIDLLATVDPGHPRYDGLDTPLLAVAKEWRVRRLPLRDAAIDLLGTVGHPICRRLRAGLLSAQGRHAEAVRELRALAAAGDRTAAVLLRRERPAREFRALGHSDGRLTDVAFSPDGTLLAASAGTTVLVWDAVSGEPLHALRGDGQVGAIAFSPDGAVLAGNGTGRVRLWHATTGDHLRDVGRHGTGRGVAFASDGSLVAGGTVRDPTGAHLHTVPAADVLAVAVSPDGRLLATAGGPTATRRSTVRLWRRDTGEHVRDLPVDSPDSIGSLAFSPDGRLLGAASDAGVWLSDRTGRVRRLDAPGADAIAFHPGGRLVATARRPIWYDAGIRLVDPATGARVRELDSAANALAFTPDGSMLAAADATDAVVRLWQVAG